MNQRRVKIQLPTKGQNSVAVDKGFGNWKTVYNRHRRWSLDGTWEQILDGLRAGCDEAEGSNWTVSADSTVARAHQHAAGARRVPAADDLTGGFSE
jgi:transposase